MNVQVAQLIQNFLKPAGIDVQIEKLEFGTQLDQTDKGDFQASALGPLSLAGITPDIALITVYIIGLLTSPREAA